MKCDSLRPQRHGPAVARVRAARRGDGVLRRARRAAVHARAGRRAPPGRQGRAHQERGAVRAGFPGRLPQEVRITGYWITNMDHEQSSSARSCRGLSKVAPTQKFAAK